MCALAGGPILSEQPITSLRRLSIVIPAYNEESGIDGVLTQLSGLRTGLDAAGWQTEVIVVDDGSADRTAAIAGQHPDVTLIRHRANRGYGAALKTGIRHTHSDLICITDADGTYPNERIPELAARLVEGEYDMVVGARTGEKVAIPLKRRPAKWVIGQLANYVAGEPIPDLNSGLRIFKRDVALRFFGILPDGFSFTTTITLGMLTNGYLVDYIPINYHARQGKSKIKPIQDTLRFMQLVARIALYFTPLKIFTPLSLIMFLTAIAWGFFTKLVFGRLADTSTMVLVTTAIEVFMIGMLAELINQRLPNAYDKE
jgi:glycosyltransferase involved in cell wall biosynthesis